MTKKNLGRQSKAANEIHRMCKKHFNEPIIVNDGLGRVIGYGEDHMDCYLIIKRSDGIVYWHTAVGGYIFLTCLKKQGRLTSTTGDKWSDFTRLDCALDFHCPKEKEFIVKIETDKDNGLGNNHYG